jgi:hypothetical protein
MKVLKFVGRYGDLQKKHGYKFQRMYAANYMCWYLDVDGEYSGNTIWIWKRGADVVFRDYHSFSGLLGEFLVNNEPNEMPLPVFGEQEPYWHFVIDRDDCKILATDFDDKSTVYSSTMYFMRDEGGKDWEDVRQDVKDRMLPDLSYEDFCKRYRRDTIRLKFGKAIRKLMESRMVKIVEEERKG